MGKVILICGRLCCGKSTLARKLADERGAVILSCDEVSLSLFPEGLGENHDAMTDRIKCYLLRNLSNEGDCSVRIESFSSM